MTAYFQHLVEFLKLHPRWGYFIAFLVAFAESLPLIGTVIPGSITMTAVGTLIGSAILPGFSTILSAIAGAFAGDLLGYKVGLKYGDKLHTVWPFRKHPRWLGLGEDFFKKHGGKSIIIGRFIGPVRSAIPMVAGLLKMSFLRFIFSAIPSAILWAVIYFLPGILIGLLAMELPPALATKFVLFAFGSVLILWFLVWVIQRSFRSLCTLVNQLIDRLWIFLSEHRSTKPFMRCIENKNDPSNHKPLSFLLGAILTGGFFLWLGYGVFHHQGITDANEPIFYLLQSLHTSHATIIFAIFTALCFKWSALCITVILCVYFWRTQQQRSAAHLLLIFVLTVATAGIAKLVWYSPRPIGLATFDPTSSFPSGHTTFAVTIIGFLSYLIAERLSQKKRWIPYTLGGLIMLGVGISRLYLGLHWLTDVLGSLLLGLCLLCITLMSYKRRLPTVRRRRASISITVVVVCLFWLISGLKNTTQIIQDTAPLYPTYTISMATWWAHSENYAPTYSVNRLGKPDLPFNVQWAAPLDEIQAIMEQQGFEPALKNGWRYNLLRFTDKNAVYHLSFLKFLYNQQAPVLTLIKKIPGEKSILEFHLWASNVDFTDSNVPLWIGIINYRLPVTHLITQKSHTGLTLEHQDATTTLIQALPNTMHEKTITPSPNLKIVLIEKKIPPSHNPSLH